MQKLVRYAKNTVLMQNIDMNAFSKDLHIFLDSELIF